MTVAFMEATRSGTLNISGTGTSQQFVFNGAINFNANEWRVNSFAVVVGATQTFQPNITDVVYLDATAAYAGSNAKGTLSWNTLDYNEQHSTNAQAFINYGISGQTLNVTLNYRIPAFALAVTNGCTFNAQIIVSLQSIVSNPSSTPPATFDTTVTDNGTDPDGSLFDFFGLKIDPKWVLVGGAILAAVLIVRPSAPATIISSGYRAYRGRNRS